MKSYFAKLAARATFANASTSPFASRPTRDPFETTSIAEPEPAPGDSQGSHLQTRAPAQTPILPVRQVEGTTSTRIEIVESARHNSADSATSKSVNPAELGRIAPPRSQNEANLESQTQTSASERNSEFQAEQGLRKAASPDETVVLQPVSADRTKETNPVNESDTEHPAQLKDDESALLRRADAFMASFFQRRAHVAEPRAEVQVQGPPPVPKHEPVQQQQSSQLQPAPAVNRIPDPIDQPPSLVIGKLTVEVMPPPVPQPVKPPRQVLIVAGDGARRRTIPSSHRFGLGQF